MSENMNTVDPSKVITLQINPGKIGMVIGSGGKVIREITSQTGVKIDISQDGLVKISAIDDNSDLDKALDWVKTLSGQIEVGQRFAGKVRKIVDFGMFVELVPGIDGLVHISTFDENEKNSLSQKYAPGDTINVVVVNHDSVNRRIGLRIEG
jgi:polyribonucleotide nucleotidyltransferase